MYIMTYLSIIEVQIGILKYLNTVELIYVLQGRQIATFHNNNYEITKKYNVVLANVDILIKCCVMLMIFLIYQ